MVQSVKNLAITEIWPTDKSILTPFDQRIIHIFDNDGCTPWTEP
jgi:hypothetical protein